MKYVFDLLILLMRPTKTEIQKKEILKIKLFSK